MKHNRRFKLRLSDAIGEALRRLARGERFGDRVGVDQAHMIRLLICQRAGLPDEEAAAEEKKPRE